MGGRYETRNHIWLIMEYCTGGDLLNVLLQDTKLPESAICDFGYDLLDGLQFIHSKSVVCCDLKPSNILLDENGTLKFSDFGLSQLLGDIGQAGTEHSKRGTPCYMAPELFRDDGYHSFASDFWALGCVLYEMAAGRPPFVSTSFRDLMDQILEHGFPPIPGSSAEFVHLLEQLLHKERFQRPAWPGLLCSTFWRVGRRGTPEPAVLPPQPRFDAELEAQRAHQDDEAEAVAAQRQSRVERGRGEVDVMRLSRAANTNLAKEVARAQEGEGESARDGYSPGASHSQPGHEDVELTGTDVELNFNTPAEDTSAAATDRVSEMIRVGSGVGETEPAGAADGAPAGGSAVAEAEDAAEEEAIEIDEEEAIGPIRLERLSDAAAQENGGGRAAVRPVTAPEFPDASPGDDDGKRAAPPTRPATTATSTRAEQEQEAGGRVTERERVRGGVPDSGPPSLEKLMYHASDSGVKPIVSNKRIERVQEPTFDRSALPFQPRTLQQMLAMAENDQSELEKFLTAIFRSVGGPVPVQKKVNTLAYFETLCTDTGAANILINSSLMSLFVKMSKAFKSPTLKVRLASSMGLLIRHATYITEQLSEAGLVDALIAMVQDKHETVRRRSCATLGELLFYVATQSKEGSQASAPVWAVPGNVFGVLVRCLRDNDDVVAHYAAKAIENMATAASREHFTRLARNETVSELLMVFGSSSNDALRATGLSAIVRLLRRSPQLAAALAEKHGVRFLAEGMVESSHKVQQSVVTILLQSLQEPSARLIKALDGERGLTQALVKLCDHSVGPIRGKAVLAALMLSQRVGLRWLARACENKLLPAVERALRDTDNYAQECASCTAAGLIDLVPALLQQQLMEQADRTGSRRAQGIRRPQSAGGGKFEVLVHLVTSPHFRARLGTAEVLAKLGELLPSVTRLPPTDKFKQQLLSVVEAFTQHPATLVREWRAVLTSLCPALAALLSAHDGDTRFLALKLFCDIIALYVNEPSLYVQAGDPSTAGAVTPPEAGHATSTLDTLIHRQFLPQVPQLLVDEDPIPLYALKLLSTVMERAPAVAIEAEQLGLLPLTVDFLQLDHPNNNIHNLRLIEALVQSGASSAESRCIPTLYSLGLADRLVSVLEYAHANQVDSFFESVLGIVLCLLSLDNCADDNAPFVRSVECLLALLDHADTGVGELATACILALARQHPAAADALRHAGRVADFLQISSFS